MKKGLAISLCVPMLCFLGACWFLDSPASPHKDEPEVRAITLCVKGTVTDAASNDPLVARVDIYPAQGFMGYVSGTKTNDKGQYSCQGLAYSDWNYKMRVEAPGYKVQWEGIATTEEWQTKDFRLERDSTR